VKGVSSRALLLILDGVSDRPVNGHTPLQVAQTPNLDALARGGACGILDVIAPGVRPGSDTAHLALLGYDPYEYYTGRGPFEAAGVGMEVRPGDVAFRCNFATLKDGIITDRRAGRISDTDELARDIRRKVKLPVDFEFQRSTGHRAVLLLRGEGLSEKVCDTDATVGYGISQCRCIAREADRTADIVNSFVEQCRELLENHPVNEKRRASGLPPANAVLTRGSGVVPEIPPFTEKWGMRGAMVASTGLILGIGKMCGLDVSGEAAAGSPEPGGQVSDAMEALAEHDFVLLNIKAPDEFGHDGDFDGKAGVLADIDRAIKPLLSLEGVTVAVTGDHSTPVTLKNHSGDPTPLVISGEGVRTDAVEMFDEFSCATGGLGRLRGRDIVPVLADLINRTHKFGA